MDRPLKDLHPRIKEIFQSIPDVAEMAAKRPGSK